MGQGDPSASEQNSVRSASDRLSVTITATTPDSVTTGRLFTIDARTKFDAVVDGNTERVTVDLGFSVDNSQVDTKSFELLEGNTKTRSTTYALTTPGSHDVSVTATATIDGSEHTASDSTTIESNPVDLIGDTTGAAFTVPDSMQDELKDYRDKYFVDLPYAFVLARPNELYLVFSQSEPTPSEAVVSGPRLYNDLTVGDLTFKIIAATDTTFTTTGTRASVSEVTNSPSEHALGSRSS